MVATAPMPSPKRCMALFMSSSFEPFARYEAWRRALSGLDRLSVSNRWMGHEKTMTGTTPRVLVVEDEPHILELVCLHLRHEGYECEGVADGRQALKLAETNRFDLLVLDVMIPGLDGCRSAARCQERPRPTATSRFSS